MKFTKMQGIGNDYVYVNCFKETVEDPKTTAIKVSDRHFGIGSDGLILIKPSEVADFQMDMYNADGSRGAMCGGIRCVAKYVYDYGLTDKTFISVETASGIKYLDLTVENGKVALGILMDRKVDILFSDIKMPYMNGLELTEKARELYPDLEIIIFSGYNDFTYARDALRYGVVDYVLKPVNPKEFHKTFERVQGKIQSRN